MRAGKSLNNRIIYWSPTDNAIVSYLSHEVRHKRCTLGDFAHACGLFRDRSNASVQHGYNRLRDRSAVLPLPRWTEAQDRLLLEEWEDRAYTLEVARDVIRSVGTGLLPHPPEALLTRIAARHCRDRHANPEPPKRVPLDGRKLLPFLLSPDHFDWLEEGERIQALRLAQQGGGAVFAYLELCQTPLASPCVLRR